MVYYPLATGPRLINFFKPILFMACDSSSGFREGYHTFLYGHIKYNRQSGRKRTNEQTRTWVSSKCKKGSFLCSFSCICRLSRACIFRETSTKATRNANSSLTAFPHGLLLLAVLPLDWYLTPTGLFCSPLSTAPVRFPSSTGLLSFLGPSSPRPLPVSREISSSSPLFWLRTKSDKEIVWPAHTST